MDKSSGSRTLWRSFLPLYIEVTRHLMTIGRVRHANSSPGLEDRYTHRVGSGMTFCLIIRHFALYKVVPRHRYLAWDNALSSELDS